MRIPPPPSNGWLETFPPAAGSDPPPPPRAAASPSAARRRWAKHSPTRVRGTLLQVGRAARIWLLRDGGTPASTGIHAVHLEEACARGLARYDARAGVYRLTELGAVAAAILELT